MADGGFRYLTATSRLLADKAGKRHWATANEPNRTVLKKRSPASVYWKNGTASVKHDMNPAHVWG